jgi:hypothetical protein
VSSDSLPDDPETLKAMLLAERHESERLRQIIKELQTPPLWPEGRDAPRGADAAGPASPVPRCGYPAS